MNDVRIAIQITKEILCTFESKGENNFHPNVTNSLLLLASAYSKLAIEQQQKKYIDSSKMYVDRGMLLAKKYEDKEAQVMFILNRGINAYELEKFQACLDILKTVEQLSIEQKLMREIPLIYLCHS